MPDKKSLDPFSKIPTEQDWDDLNLNEWLAIADPDSAEVEDAHIKFFGKTREEVVPLFLELPLCACECLYYMPAAPFQYYVLAFEILANTERQFGMNGSDTASCFLELVKRRLARCPATIVPVMEKLMPTLEYVAANQERYDADIDIYGSFPEKLTEIKTLYAKLL